MNDVKLNTKRCVRETGLETRIAAIIGPAAQDLGYALVRVSITRENGCTLRIMAEDENGHFTITDCERLSREINPVLDVEDPIDRGYHLEVSSPGIDRPLVRARDFRRWQGHEARLELQEGINGRRRFRGLIVSSNTRTVTIALPDVAAGADPERALPFSDIAEAKLVMTDALLEAARQNQKNQPAFDETDVETVEDTSNA